MSQLETLNLWKIKHSLSWQEGPRGDERRLDNLVTQVATASDNPADAIKLAESSYQNKCKLLEFHEIKRAGFVEVAVSLL